MLCAITPIYTVTDTNTHTHTVSNHVEPIRGSDVRGKGPIVDHRWDERLERFAVFE